MRARNRARNLFPSGTKTCRRALQDKDTIDLAEWVDAEYPKSELTKSKAHRYNESMTRKTDLSTTIVRQAQ